MKKSDPATASPLKDGDQGFKLDPSLTAVNSKIRDAIAYWKAKRGDRLAPMREDMNPREIKSFLPNFQIRELVDGGPAYRARLMGTAIVAAMKEDITGHLFDETTQRPAARRALRAVRWVIEHKEPLRTFAERTAVEGQDFLSHESVFLPLSSDGKTIDQLAVVGVFAPAVK
jgi:hypothetical protein